VKRHQSSGQLLPKGRRECSGCGNVSVLAYWRINLRGLTRRQNARMRSFLPSRRPQGFHVVESPAEIRGTELEVLRAGVRLMALRALANADLADEVAQETIVRAFHSLRTSRPDKLGPFVAGIARHVITDIIRARPREAPLETLPPDFEAQTSRDPLVMLCDASEQARVHQALGELAEEDRRLLQLVYSLNFPPARLPNDSACRPAHSTEKTSRPRTSSPCVEESMSLARSRHTDAVSRLRRSRSLPRSSP